MGGGGGHGAVEAHHPHLPKVPDWRTFTVESAPECVKYQKLLASEGLKDPWLRNEVWRYHPEWGTANGRNLLFYFRGFKTGSALFVATIVLEKVWSLFSPSKDEHHGHH